MEKNEKIIDEKIDQLLINEKNKLLYQKDEVEYIYKKLNDDFLERDSKIRRALDSGMLSEKMTEFYLTQKKELYRNFEEVEREKKSVLEGIDKLMEQLNRNEKKEKSDEKA